MQDRLDKNIRLRVDDFYKFYIKWFKTHSTAAPLTSQKFNDILRNIYGDRKDPHKLENRVYKHNAENALCVMGLEINKEKLNNYYSSFEERKKYSFSQYLSDLFKPYLQ